MREYYRNLFAGLSALSVFLVFALPCSAQVSLGKGFALSNANGTLGVGYDGSYGNIVDSAHSLDFSGSGNINGYYYNPAFISFSAQPYYGETRANSQSRSISNASGINLSSNIFGNSQFPGYISFSKNYNSVGNYAVPGLPNFTTNGNTDTFGIGWSANLRGFPSLSVNFQNAGSSYTIYGEDIPGKSSSHAVSLHSNYSILGFNLGGSYSYTSSNNVTPDVLNGGVEDSSSTGGDSYSFSVSHKLPMQGSFGAGFIHTDASYNIPYAGTSGNQGYDNIYSSASFRPWRKFGASVALTYVDNLGGEISQQLLDEGVPYLNTQSLDSSTAMNIVSSATYSVADGLVVGGEYERSQQAWANTNYGANYYSANATYSRRVYGGALNVGSSVTAAVQDQSSENNWGFSNTVSYGHNIGIWQVTGSFSYEQNVQTLLIAYTTSNYNFSGNLHRRIKKKLYWNLGASGARSGFVAIPGDSNTSESVITSLVYPRWFTFASGYQRSNGLSFLGPNGLEQSTLPSTVVSPTLQYQSSGHSYSFSASSSPVKHLSLSVTYAETFDNTSSNSAISNNNSSEQTITAQYQLRKLYVNGGYSRFSQGFTAVASIPAQTSSFYVGVNRWFKAF